MSNVSLRQLGKSNIYVSPVALGCWPIAGMTSLDVNETDSLKTIDAAIEAGVNFFDTAYGYGLTGESEKLIARCIQGRRDDFVIATKCGLGWDENAVRIIDGRPENLARQTNTSLSRLEADAVDLLYLHAPDPNTPLSESAGMLRELQELGKARLIGVSNFTIDQIEQFHAVCPISVVQPPYNMLQRGIEKDIVPWCQQNQVSLAVYWPLLKGLLAGKLSRDHVFQPGDGRPKYPMFQGEEWQRNQDFVDELRSIALDTRRTVAQLVVRWTLEQPGITTALCGAKRAYQIEESAAAMQFELSADDRHRIDTALNKRGVSNAHGAV